MILNEQASSYAQELQDSLEALVGRASRARGDGGRSARSCSSCGRTQLSVEAARLLQPAARAVLLSRRGTLGGAARAAPAASEPATPPRRRRAARARGCRGEPPRRRPELEFFNGLGGFADDGREYVTILGAGAVDAGAVDQRRSPTPRSASRSRVRGGATRGR